MKCLIKNALISIRNNYKDSLIVLVVIFILVNFLFIILSTSEFNERAIDKVENSIEIRSVYNLKTDNADLNADPYSLNSYYNEIITNLKELKSEGLDLDFSCFLGSRAKDDKRHLELNVGALLNLESLEYYGYKVESNKELNNNFVLVDKMFATYFDYQIGEEIELVINDKTYKYIVNGTFESISNSALLYNSSIMSGLNILMDVDSLMEIVNEDKIMIAFNNVAIRYYGIDNVDDYNQKLANVFKVPFNKYFDSHKYQDDIVTNKATIEQLIMPLNNAKNLFDVMKVLLLVISFLIMFTSITYIIKKRLNNLTIYRTLGLSKSKTVISVLIEMLCITSISILISLPIASFSNQGIQEIFVNINQERQRELEYLSNESRELDEFINNVDVYEGIVDKEVLMKSYLVISAEIYLIVIISSVIGLNEIIYNTPKELMYKKKD